MNSSRRVACLAGGVWLAVLLGPFAGAADDAPHQVLRPGAEGVRFVDDARCRTCHAEAARAWAGSDHALAMQVASAETVLGDFDQAVFSAQGVETRFFRRDGRFFVRTEGPDGKPGDFEITHTFGVRPLQQYLVPFPGGRLQALDVAWDVERGAWFSLRPDERIAPDDALHWTGRFGSWNAMCAECHSTDLHKGYDPEADRYDTTWAAIDVGCQACHGPGARHLDWATRSPRARTGRPWGLVVDLARTTAAGQVDACARCHALRHRVSPEDQHGRAFLDDFAPRRLEAGLYFADGQIQDEVYVYGSFVQSRMHRAGVRCTDCHDPHSAGLRASGDALCTRCHQPEPGQALRAAFPSLPTGDYASKAHHHHDPASEAARCVTCHMPARTYMEIDARRDHSLRVPRPDLTVRYGVPNPCTTCHSAEPASWAAAKVVEWFGPERKRGADFTAVFHDARAGAPGSGPALAALAVDASQAPIVRATALAALAGAGPSALPSIEAGLADADPLVRVAAVGAMEGLRPDARPARLAPLLADDVRAVRVEAARLLASVPPGVLSPEDQARLDAALSEWVATQLAVADTAPAWLNLAVYRTERGEIEQALAAYARALEIDRRFLPAWANLAQLHAATGHADRAEAVLNEAIEVEPDFGEFYYSLGLLLAEQGRMAESRDALAKAAKRLPRRPRVHYNLGLAEQHLGRMPAATRALERAHALAPTDPAILQALTILFVQTRDWEGARRYAEQWVAADPRNPSAQGTLQRIRMEMER